MNTTLLIMAAGIGSRFGTGIKQLEPVDAATVSYTHLIIRQFPEYNYMMASYEPFGKTKYIDITSKLNQL